MVVFEVGNPTLRKLHLERGPPPRRRVSSRPAAEALTFARTGELRVRGGTSLLPRLVLCWIEADFRVQIHIFQHFAKCTRNHLLASKFGKFLPKKKLEIFARILTVFGKFCNFLQNFQKSAKFCKILQNFLQNFAEIRRF